MRVSLIAAAVCAGMALSACADKAPTNVPAGNARVEVTSDPAGGQVFLDGNNTGKVTPALLSDLTTQVHEVLVRMDRDNVAYGFRTSIDAKGDSLAHVTGPLVVRLTDSRDFPTYSKYHTLGSLRISAHPNGPLFHYDQTGRGMYYPAGTANQYVSMGLPLISYTRGVSDTLSLGIYDYGYLAGRPAPTVTQASDRYSLKQSFWIVPPTNIIIANQPTVRGIEVDEELIGVNATNDVAFVKVTFRNITNKASYQSADPFVPVAGYTYNWVYVGFGLDPDIGGAADDLISYDPSLNMVYAYDSDFAEPEFALNHADKPALVGLRLLEAPSNATVKALNAWISQNDWHGGDSSERVGWGVISGFRSFLPDFPGQQIGHVPVAPGDYRISVSAGPISLAPGDAASITVAIIVAAPVAGTYTPGQFVDGGNPTVTDRQLAKIAAGLSDKARNLVVPQ